MGLCRRVQTENDEHVFGGIWKVLEQIAFSAARFLGFLGFKPLKQRL